MYVLFKSEVPALGLLYPPLSRPSRPSRPKLITYVLNSTHNFVIKHNQVTKGFYHNSIGILKSAAAAFPTRILIEIPLSSDFLKNSDIFSPENYQLFL